MSIKVKGYKNAIKLREIQNDLIEYEDIYVSMEDLRKIYEIALKNLPCYLDDDDLNFEYFLPYIETI